MRVLAPVLLCASGLLRFKFPLKRYKMRVMNASENLAQIVREVVQQTPIVDIHTHLFAPRFGTLALWGIDALLDYHYLVAETLRRAPLEPAAFFALSQSARADIVWRELFANRAPLSDAARGVIAVLSALGLDANTRDLESLRCEYSRFDIETHLDACMKIANLRRIGMTNSPFDDEERAIWNSREYSQDYSDARFFAALRLDPLLMEPEKTALQLRSWNYDFSPELGAKSFAETRRFLNDWADKMQPAYAMVSLPPDFAYPAPENARREDESTAASTRDDAFRAQLLDGAILPFCRERNLPFAMMLGVRRAVNPKLQMAGDGLERSDLNALRELCARHPDNKFMVTVLSRENQHELCVLARKFSNLHVFGCWWFCNIPSLVEEITTMRVELLGADFTLQHSDARVYDQLIYKWRDAREAATKVLTRKYANIETAGRAVTRTEIEADARELFGGAFGKFLEK